jgi:hypothetical protein
MVCPVCKCELYIESSRYVIKDDKLYMVQDFICRNAKCTNKDKVVQTDSDELPVERA